MKNEEEALYFWYGLVGHEFSHISQDFSMSHWLAVYLLPIGSSSYLFPNGIPTWVVPGLVFDAGKMKYKDVG